MRVARGKKKIGDDDEPINVDELVEKMKEDVGTPQTGRNKNFEKFLRLGPWDAMLHKLS